MSVTWGICYFCNIVRSLMYNYDEENKVTFENKIKHGSCLARDYSRVLGLEVDGSSRSTSPNPGDNGRRTEGGNSF